MASDLLAPDLKLLFCGYNPSLRSGHTGCYHYAHPGNRFWRVLDAAGITERLYAPDEDAQLLESGIGFTKVNGPQAMRQTAEWLLAQFPDLRMTVEAMVAEGDTVAVRVLSEGTNLGSLNGVVPPTGKRFSARQSHWFRVEDGKLVEHWATREDLPTMLQLGIIQPPGGPPS